MIGPELDGDLEAIGRRLSPAVGAAHDAVIARATRGGTGHRPLGALPRPGRLGGAALTLVLTAGFAALLAVGVADRPAAGPGGSGPGGPSVAMAPAPAAPGAAGSTAPVTTRSEPGATTVAPAPPAASTPAAPPTTAPIVSRPVPVTVPAPSTPASAPDATPSAPPTTAPTADPAPSTTAAPTSPGSPPPSPHAAPTAPARVVPAPTSSPSAARIVLTEADSGRTITVRRGDVVEVDLSAPSNGMLWTEPQTTDQTVVRRTSGRTNPDGSASGVFGAAGDGRAQIEASRVPPCATATPRCLPPQRIDFVVTIIVTG